MPKTPFLVGNDTVADGKHRKSGKIYRLEETSASALAGSGRGRAPTAEEIDRLGVEEDPVEDAGTHVRDFGAQPKPAAVGKGPKSNASAGNADQAG